LITIQQNWRCRTGLAGHRYDELAIMIRFARGRGWVVCAGCIVTVGVLIGALSLPAHAAADDCIVASGARIYASASGRHGFRLTSGNAPSRIEGLLFGFDHAGEEKRIWRTRLRTVPVRVLVADDGRTVVAVDEV
jgi:hypothetical protein